MLMDGEQRRALRERIQQSSHDDELYHAVVIREAKDLGKEEFRGSLAKGALRKAAMLAMIQQAGHAATLAPGAMHLVAYLAFGAYLAAGSSFKKTRGSCDPDEDSPPRIAQEENDMQTG